MNEEALLAFRDRFGVPLSDERGPRRRLLPAAAPTARRWSTCASGARRSAAACRRAAPTRRRSRCRPLSAFEALLTGTGDRAISTTMAFVRVLSTLLRDKGIGHHVVPIVPDESRTFGMEGMFRQLGIFSQVGQLYTPEDADQLMFYREDKKGQILAGGHHRGRRDLVVDRGRHLVRQPRRADDPVLHLLLDVRLPAGRRPGLGRRRQPGARLPARRHLRAHHAQRRGPAARGRPQPRRRRHRPQLPRLRPDLRLRGGGDRAGRPAAHAHRAGGRLLLPHGAERELPPAGDARGRRARGSCAACTWSHAAVGRRARACSCWAPARSCARCWPPPSCCRRTTASAPTSGASPASPSCAATAWRPSAGTASTPPRSRRVPYVDRGPRRPRRAGGRGDRLHARVRRRHPRLRAGPLRGARHRRLRPQRLPRQAAPLLRGRPPPRRGRGPRRPGARGR